MRIRRIRSHSSGPRRPTRFWPASRDSPSAPPTRGPYNFCHEPSGQDTRSELSRIRFSRNEYGRLTRRTIEVNENGETCYYDRCVEFDVVALSVNGNRVTV